MIEYETDISKALPVGTEFSCWEEINRRNVEVEIQTKPSKTGFQDYRWRIIYENGYVGKWFEAMASWYRLVYWKTQVKK